ncbi:MAG: bifunctional salicylyl-CoA 5-hydroxylase/oxidoreductase [Acidobacteriota bacterium]
MKVNVIGGGPAGLYFGILMKKADPRSEIAVFERNKPDDTFGFGVVFSDATIGNLEAADAETYAEIRKSLAHWDDIDIHWKGSVITSRGHGFSGMSRKALLAILQRRASDLGVAIAFEREIPSLDGLLDADLVLAADGVNSTIRALLKDHFRPSLDWRPNRFVWLGTTYPFRAFTFYFRENEHGLFRVHAYRYEPGASTFIVEGTEESWRRSGLADGSEDDTIAYCEALFAEELAGHRLIKNRSLWRSFPTVKNERWHHDNVVLVGDAAHTAHFSIGSGTKLAMEDAIALAEHVCRGGPVPDALAAYEAERRPVVESTQRAAQVSLEWFESTERYRDFEPIPFAFSLLTRSLRVTHANLKARDPELVARVDEHARARAEAQARIAIASPAPPPMFLPFRLRELVLANRVVVSPMCQYSADDGTVSDWHLVHLGSRAMGGAGLVITEMTDVSPEGRISPGCAGMYRPEHVAAWRRVTAFVHEHAPAKIGIQLAHAGRKGSTCRPWEGDDDAPPLEGSWAIVGPSAIPFLPGGQVPRAMDRADMDKVRDDFVRATKMALDAGFDFIELHGAHGYLLSSFLSPLSNRRTDAYGGILESRLRFPIEVFDAVRAAWPREMPLGIRISASDWREGGVDGAEAVEIARAFKAHGCDVVDVSSGGTSADARPVYGRLYQTPFAERIRVEAGIPTMTVGAISTFEDCNSIVAAGRADLCVLARQHLYDPYFARHAAFEQGHAMPWPRQYAAIDRYRPRPGK